MAIYSLHHSAIGRATQARPHTAAAHIGYITRRPAMSRYEAARMPDGPRRVAAHLAQLEDRDRKNARIVDKVRLALPRELDPDQRAQLVRDFAEEVTHGRAPWLAAFHDQGKDAGNPHCHLVIRDRDPETGRRVAGLSENGSTEKLREAWERHANQALTAAGRAERIDRRTLKEQGIARAPTIHEGPRSQGMVKRGAVPVSRPREVRNRPGSRSRGRVVDYPTIDGGRSRPAYNAAIGAAAGQETEAALWAVIDADTLRRDFEARGYGADAARYAQQQESETMARRPSQAHLLGTPEGEHARIAREKEERGQDATERRPDDLQRQRIAALEGHLSPNEHEAALRAGLARKDAEQQRRPLTGPESVRERFFLDRSRPVDTSASAPRIRTYEANEKDLEPFEYDRPQTPREQQTMSWGEALDKRVNGPMERLFERSDTAQARFLHDPSKAVRTGEGAPTVQVPGRTPHDDWVQIPQTPHMQQRMSFPEAIYKRVVKPAITGERFQGASPEEFKAAREHDLQQMHNHRENALRNSPEQSRVQPEQALNQANPHDRDAERAARKEQLMQQMRDQEQARKLDKSRTRSR